MRAEVTLTHERQDEGVHVSAHGQRPPCHAREQSPRMRLGSDAGIRQSRDSLALLGTGHHFPLPLDFVFDVLFRHRKHLCTCEFGEVGTEGGVRSVLHALTEAW